LLIATTGACFDDGGDRCRSVAGHGIDSAAGDCDD
jgi:hypothetical protein